MIDEENGQTRKTKGGKKYQKKQKGKKGKIAGIIVAIILILLVILLGVGTGMVAGKISKFIFDIFPATIPNRNILVVANSFSRR